MRCPRNRTFRNRVRPQIRDKTQLVHHSLVSNELSESLTCGDFCSTAVDDKSIFCSSFELISAECLENVQTCGEPFVDLLKVNKLSYRFLLGGGFAYHEPYFLTSNSIRWV